VQALELILFMLAVSAAFELIARKLSIPLPTLLVVGGLVLAVMPGLPRAELPPDIVFLIFVPPLVYWAALTISFQDFRDNIRSITLLGVGLVLATMAIVATAAHAIVPGLSWGPAFVLGAIVSPPDVIAVTAVTRRLNLPHVIITILEGEGLVNDATAFVAYRIAVTAVVAGTFSIWQSGLRLIWTAAAGIVLGLVAGWLIGRIRSFVGHVPVVENTISLLTPFAVFIPAERLGLSSVLAVATTGLYLSRQGPKIISAETRLQGQAMWEILNFVLEGMIFIMIGVELPLIRRAVGNYPLPTLAGYTLLLSTVLILVRVAWTFPGAYLPRLIRRKWLSKRDSYPSWRGVLFTGWAGVRGADSLVIALAIPLTTASGAQFPGRNIIILITFGVILFTLVLQGLTLSPLIKLLKLRDNTDTEQAEEAHAQLRAIQAGIERLSQLAKEQWATPEVVEDIRKWYGHRIHLLNGANFEETLRDRRNATAYVRLRLATIAAERQEIIRLRDQDEIGDDILRIIQRDLDFEEVRLAENEWS